MNLIHRKKVFFRLVLPLSEICKKGKNVVFTMNFDYQPYLPN